MNRQHTLARGLKSNEVWSCRLLWLVCFSLMLPVAMVARLSGWRWQPWPAGANGYRSVFHEARHVSTSLAGSVFSA